MSADERTIESNINEPTELNLSESSSSVDSSFQENLQTERPKERDIFDQETLQSSSEDNVVSASCSKTDNSDVIPDLFTWPKSSTSSSSSDNDSKDEETVSQSVSQVSSIVEKEDKDFPSIRLSPPGLGVLNAKRCLWKVNQKEVDSYIKTELNLIRKEEIALKSSKWNFDFEKDTPLSGDFTWQQEQRAPSFYHAKDYPHKKKFTPKRLNPYDRNAPSSSDSVTSNLPSVSSLVTPAASSSLPQPDSSTHEEADAVLSSTSQDASEVTRRMSINEPNVIKTPLNQEQQGFSGSFVSSSSPDQSALTSKVFSSVTPSISTAEASVIPSSAAMISNSNISQSPEPSSERLRAGPDLSDSESSKKRKRGLDSDKNILDNVESDSSDIPKEDLNPGEPEVEPGGSRSDLTSPNLQISDTKFSLPSSSFYSARSHSGSSSTVPPPKKKRLENQSPTSTREAPSSKSEKTPSNGSPSSSNNSSPGSTSGNSSISPLLKYYR